MDEKAGGKGEVGDVFIYLCVRGASQAIEFYKKAFFADELFRMAQTDGDIGHAEIKLGSATLMLADERPGNSFKSPQSYGGTSAIIHLHVQNVDTMAERAHALGAEILRGPSDEPHGERQCLLRDPFGHQWLLGHQIGVVTEQ